MRQTGDRAARSCVGGARRWRRGVVALVLGTVVAFLCPGVAVAQAAPGIPTGVSVAAADAGVSVAWRPPDDDGGAPISGYTVTAIPGGATASVPGVARAATVTGLTNGVAYRVTVTAANRVGAGRSSAVSDAVTPTAAAGVTGTVLVEEDFATSVGSMEPVAGGDWAVSSGRYVLSVPADGGEEVPNANLAVAGPVVRGDVTLTARASTTATDSPFNDFSVVFGYRDPADYWFASFSEGNDANTSGVFRVEGGVRRELADITSPVVAGTVYAVRIERAGTELRVFRTGEQVAAVSDAASTDGRVGFGSRNDGATFDDLVVTAPVPAPAAEQKGFLARLWAWLTG